MMVKMTETTIGTADEDYVKYEFVYNEFWEITAEYVYQAKKTDGSIVFENGNVVYEAAAITDKYALFQLEKMVITEQYLKGFAEYQGYSNFVDADGDNVIDVFTEDNNGDGVADLANDFGQAMMDATVFADPKPLMDGDTQRVDSNGEPVYEGEPQIQWSGTQGLSDIIGFQLQANGFEMKLFGQFSFTVPENKTIFDFEESWISGEINSVYIYDTANGGALVAYSDTLDINFGDLFSFMGSRPDTHSDDGPPSSSGGTDYAVDGHSDPNAVHIIDTALFDKIGDLETQHSVTAPGPFEAGKLVTTALIDFLVQIDGPNNGGDVYNLGSVSGGGSVSDGGMHDGDQSDDGPAPFTLTELMGGAEKFSSVGSSLQPEESGMGFEVRYDPMGNKVEFRDDGFGNITETMTDPTDADIQIRTEFFC
jgi:hypothetical protein